MAAFGSSCYPRDDAESMLKQQNGPLSAVSLKPPHREVSLPQMAGYCGIDMQGDILRILQWTPICRELETGSSSRQMNYGCFGSACNTCCDAEPMLQWTICRELDPSI